MPGIRLATTVAFTYKAEDDINDLPADEAAEHFRDNLQADLRQVYGDVEAIEVGDAAAARSHLDAEVLATCADLVEAALEDLATFDCDQYARPPREVVNAVRVAQERYRRAVKAIEAARSAA